MICVCRFVPYSAPFSQVFSAAGRGNAYAPHQARRVNVGVRARSSRPRLSEQFALAALLRLLLLSLANFRSLRSTKTKTPAKGRFCFGAAGRGRTDTVSLPPDFESGASANSTTAACCGASALPHRVFCQIIFTPASVSTFSAFCGSFVLKPMWAFSPAPAKE